ncbi:MAG: XdhC family protein, partial [Anaerolineae bacterium]|nr:XdhC family protein [Anaerolineae bacterium]
MTMHDDFFQHAAAWLDAGDPVAVATIMRIRGSSSQPLGARMLITTDNRFRGAVSGGCVETDVYEAAQYVLSGGGALMLHYKRVENPVIEIGLNCDGMIDVLVEPLDRALLKLLTEPGGAVVTLCDPMQPLAPGPVHARVAATGTVTAALPVDLPAEVIDAAQSVCRDDRPASLMLPDHRHALIEPRLAPPLLWIAGAESIAAPLAQF